MRKKWFIGVDISKKTLDVVIYDSKKKHSDSAMTRRDSIACFPGSKVSG